MAINFVEQMKQLFKRPVDVQRIREKIPFIQLFGYEKTFGAPQPQDFSGQIDQYKSWIYACAWKNAISIAKNKICIYRRKKMIDDEEELERVYQHPFLDIITSVNPFSNKFELFTITQINLELTGNAYWWMPRNELGIPYMIWNIPSHWVKIVPSKEQFISGYIVQAPGQPQQLPFEEKDIVHFKFPSPFNLFYGIGPTWASRFSAEMNTQIKNWGVNYFLNNAQPGGALIAEHDLSPEQFQRLRDQWNAKHKGSSNAGKLAILGGGLKYEQLGSNVRDTRFELVSQEVRDEILAIFGVPASKLGLESHDNRATAEASDYTYQKETIYPRLMLIEEKMNEKIIPMYLDGRDDLVVKFDNPVPDDNEFRLREKQINIQTGITTIDEERQKEGLNPFNLPETSKPLIPFNLVPAGEKPPDLGFGIPADDKPKEGKDEKSINKSIQERKDKAWEMFAIATTPIERLMTGMMKRFFNQQHSEVMKRLNNLKSLTNAVEKDFSVYVLFNMVEENRRLKGKSMPYVRNALMTGLTLGARSTNSTINFDLFEPNIVRALEKRLDYFTLKTNETTSNLIKEAIGQGIEKGETITEIGKRLDKVYSFRENFSSRLTAQTEVIGATNEGKLMAFKEAGVKKQEWVTARDEKVRDSHQIEGQIVDAESGYFLTGLGSRLRYPGDRSTGAPAEDIINCRCTNEPVIEI